MMHSICGNAASFSRVVEHAGGARLHGAGETGGGVLLLRPADALQRSPRLADIEIGNADHMQPLDALRLRQDHRAELARPDNADADGAFALDTLRQEDYGDSWCFLPQADLLLDRAVTINRAIGPAAPSRDSDWCET